MKSTLKLLLLGLIVSSSLTLLGCGSGTPTSPSGGATIVGTVNPSSVASSFSVHGASSSSGSGITVSVIWTSLSATTDSSGNFVLTGVPEGAVTLRFQGSGIDATLEVSGLVAGQTLTITIHLSGSTATLGAPPSPGPSPSPSPVQQQCPALGQKAEVEGLITATTSSSITVFQGGQGEGQLPLAGPQRYPHPQGEQDLHTAPAHGRLARARQRERAGLVGRCLPGEGRRDQGSVDPKAG